MLGQQHSDIDIKQTIGTLHNRSEILKQIE